MRKCLITYLVGVLLISSIQADEGMWLIPLIKDLNMDRMQEMGLELEADDIYFNSAVIRSAIYYWIEPEVLQVLPTKYFSDNGQQIKKYIYVKDPEVTDGE